MKSVKLRHSLLTVIGLVLSLLIVVAFVFMATKFNPQKTRGYADQFFQHSFPQYNVEIDDASVRIGLVTTITFKKIAMSPKNDEGTFLNVEKAQVKISLSSLLFRKKPIDVILDNLVINEAYFRPFLHQYLIKEPLTNPQLLIPEFVREVGVNIKSRSFNLIYNDTNFAFSRLTIRGRPDNLWAYEIEGTHLWEGHSFEHITVGEIHFFERASQINFYTHNNEFKILDSGATYKDLKTQGNIEVPESGTLSATFSINQGDALSLTVSLKEEENEIKIREVSGQLPADLYRALGIGHQPKRIGDSPVLFLINDDETNYSQKNGKREQTQKYDIIDYSYSKKDLSQSISVSMKQNENPVALNLVDSNPLGNISIIYKSNKLSSLFIKDVNQYVFDIVKQYLPISHSPKLKQMIFEFDECFKDQLSCRIHLDQSKIDSETIFFKGDLISSDSKFKANVDFQYDLDQNNGFQFDIKNLNTSMAEFDLPVKGNCQFGFTVRKIQNIELTLVKCSNGTLDPSFFSKGLTTAANFIQFKKFELKIDNDNYALQIIPLKGRSLKISGPYEKVSNQHHFYFDEQKTIGFLIFQNENTYQIENIGN